jgi:hypothetical protein
MPRIAEGDWLGFVTRFANFGTTSDHFVDSNFKDGGPKLFILDDVYPTIKPILNRKPPVK